MTYMDRIESAIQDLRSGKMIILTDDPDRENEGDLIMPAENITDTAMNFMIRHGTGIVCISMPAACLRKFNLPLMVAQQDNTSPRGTPFTISVDARHGISTGVSASDRVMTIRAMMDPHASADELVRPGHVFPLLAREGGVFERRGHTEGALDLARLAGFAPAAVLCEIMNPDGSMARGEQLEQFAARHDLRMLSISDIVDYRLRHENLIAAEASAKLPVDGYGQFSMTVLREKYSNAEHVVLRKDSDSSAAPLVRIHSSCMTGDLFASQRCDCREQLHHALERISREGGMLIYLQQEGRGIGLFDKIRAYALQEQGFDTAEANIELGLPVDARQYHIAANILRHYGLNEIRLMTANPDKIMDLQKYGIASVTVETMPSFQSEQNCAYLKIKREKLHHYGRNTCINASP